MAGYISKFLDSGIRHLLKGNGQKFLEEYYSTIEKIYNYEIPLKDIASKGKVKKTIPDYIEDCNTITAAGRPKSRQAWMELAIREGIDVNLGETLYYVNTGKSKSHADCKKVKKYFREVENIFGIEKCNCTTEVEKEYKKYKSNGGELTIEEYVSKYRKDVTINEEIILNCKLIPKEKIENEEEEYIDETIMYNVSSYIDKFNKRIKPMLVCFSPEIRDRILITNPSERPYFTEEECELSCGYPNNAGDQDTYEELMRMDDREIEFWMRHEDWEIPFLKECNMDWDSIKADYIGRKEREKQLGIDAVRKKYEEALSRITNEDIENLYDGKIPSSIEKLVYVDPVTGRFMDKTYNDIEIGTIYDILDCQTQQEDEEEEVFA